MSDPLIYLSVERVITLHNRIMTRMRVATAPLRSLALLESAVLRPQHLAYYQGADIAEQATALAVGISQNQPFLDGNKRTAFIAMEAFLAMNGFRIEALPYTDREEARARGREVGRPGPGLNQFRGVDQGTPRATERMKRLASMGCSPIRILDPAAKAHYIRLSNTEVQETEELAEGVYLDIDADGQAVGIEILDADEASLSLIPALPATTLRDFLTPPTSR